MEKSMPDQLIVSLNTYNSCEHKNITRTNMFDDVINGVKIFVKKIPRIGLSFVTHLSNYKDIPKNMELAYELGVGFVYFVNVLPHFGMDKSDKKNFIEEVIKVSDIGVIREINSYKKLDVKNIVEHWPVPIDIDNNEHCCESPFVSACFGVINGKIYVGGCRRVMPPQQDYYYEMFDKSSSYSTIPLNNLRYDILTNNVYAPCKYCFGRKFG